MFIEVGPLQLTTTSIIQKLRDTLHKAETTCPPTHSIFSSFLLSSSAPERREVSSSVAHVVFLASIGL
jgi:hypothetical protein